MLNLTLRRCRTPFAVWRVFAAVGAAVVLTLAGCGGTDDGGTTQATPPDATQDAQDTPNATATPTVDEAADKRIAADALLTLEDFPSGWTEADDDGESSGSTCDAIADARKNASARATSPSFNLDDTQTQNVVYVFPDEDAARAAFAAIAGDDTRGCIADSIAQVLEERDGIDAGEARTGRLAIDPLGDQREAARIAFPVKAEGVDVDITTDLVYVRTGRAIAFGLFFDTFTAFDDELREDLTGKIVRRLSAGVS